MNCSGEPDFPTLHAPDDQKHLFLGSRPSFFAPVQVQAFASLVLKGFLGTIVKTNCEEKHPILPDC
jgi:hypothetical protein